MGKTQKSKLYNFFSPLPELPSHIKYSHVIDGGYLLHKVVLDRRDTLENILNRYITHVRKHYSATSTIIFNGYLDPPHLCTKSSERQRRRAREMCSENVFNLAMTTTVSQKHFLSNDNNKKRLILMLCEKLEAAGFSTKQAFEDAATLNFKTNANSEEAAILLGII